MSPDFCKRDFFYLFLLLQKQFVFLTQSVVVPIYSSETALRLSSDLPVVC